MARPTFRYRRGAPIAFDLVVSDPGTIDPASLTIRIDAKPATPGGQPADGGAATACGVAFHPAVGAMAAFWRATISGAVTAGMIADLYVADAVLELAGEVIEITDYVVIELIDGVTAP